MASKKLSSLESVLIALFVLMTCACIGLIVVCFLEKPKSSEAEGCGTIQHLSGASGSFASLNYPSNYDDSKNCMWEITVEQNKVIHLWFAEFHLEASTLCTADHVTVEDGAGTLGTFCGHSTPKPLVSIGNKLLISFTSNSKTTDKGFKAQYEAVDPSKTAEIIGGGGHLQGNTGDFGTPDTSARAYKNDAIYQWKISVASGYKIKLTFTSFDLEPAGPAGCKDVVEVYDGDTKGSLKLGHFCGRQIPGPVYSSSHILVVRFTSDSEGSGNGFHATYSAFQGNIPATTVSPSSSTTTTTTTSTTSPPFIDSGCDSNALQRGRKGVIHSKNYPDTYPANLQCKWDITVAEGFLVKLAFTELAVDGDLGSCIDKINISDTSDVIGNYCGYLKPPVIISSSNKLFATFSTDDIRTDKGFEAKWEAVHPEDILEIQSCGGGSNAETGVIKSPNWPYNYRPNTACVWVIEVPQGKKVHLTFTDFDLEDVDLMTRDCYDYVSAFEERPGQTVTHGRFCGTTIPSTIITQGNRIALRFQSDLFTEGKGFRAYWTTDPLTPAPTEAPPPPNAWDDIQIEWPNTCGKPTYPPQINTRIVNGEPAAPHTWPWQVSMQVWPSSRNETIFFHTCGGTLIHKNWILTAAHCFINYADELYRWQMCLGKHNLTLVEPTEKCFKVLGIYRHELFVYPEIPALEFDVALVKIDGEVAASDVIDFACLPPYDEVLNPNYRCHATGWGDETGNSAAPKVAESLNQVVLPVIPYETCKTPQYWWFQLKQSMICAGYILPDELKSVCQGDSGGPLVCPSTSQSGIWEVHGITSFGPIGCIMDKKPSVFTRASAHLDWIDQIIKKDTYDIHSSGCGSAKNLYDPKGHFTSMRYPSSYKSDATCTWNIIAEEGKVIHLHFDGFVLEESTGCMNDKVIISDELSSLGTHCGTLLPSDLVSFRNSISVNFQTNSRVVDKGFSISWEVVSPASIPSIAQCGGHFLADNGFFMSTNWPDANYPGSKACIWKIAVEAGKQINIVFTDFELQPANLTGSCHDYVEIFDGDRAGAVKLGHFCGNRNPGILNTTGNTAVIKFISNHERHFKGFRGYWTTNITDVPSLPLRPDNPWNDILIEWPTSCNSISSSKISGTSGLHSSQWHFSVQSRARPFLPFQHTCAGSLIHSEWLLLPAHCIDESQKLDSWRVCLGHAPEKCFSTDAIIKHENFAFPQNNDHSYDIALMHISEKVTEVQPACLPASTKFLPAGELCYWAGWAASSKGGAKFANTKEKFQVPIPILSYETCSQPKFWWSQLTTSMICAGFESAEKLKSECRNEAEGALFCKSSADAAWEIHGIASFGPSDCVVDKKPPVFTRVSAYKDWIENAIQKYTYEKNI
ncbi:ovochymase-2 [Xenopus tropicalis]|uniref:GPRIN family member 3 n=1 Tax=Xenopus tropicalis TaxID=8364 RepID=F7D3H1_XENTR|nr:ovochymase-2 [Xenopus tropicalis]